MVKKTLFMSVILFFVLISSVWAEEILVAGENFPPFEFEKDGKVQGIDIDIANAIFAKMNVTAKYEILPWARAWKYVENGKIDAVFSTSRKDERIPFLYYPNEDMWTSEYVFFVKKDKKKEKFSGYEDAKGKKIGIIRGNSYHPSFWEAKLETEEAVDIDQNLKKLDKGRVDLVIVDKTVGLYAMKLLDLQNSLTYYDVVLFSKGYPMPFVVKSEKNGIKEISEKFDAELKKFKQSDEYQKIIDKWLK